MKVRTISRIMTPRGEIPAGEIVVIPDEVYERLRGKVEPTTQQSTPIQCNDRLTAAGYLNRWVLEQSQQRAKEVSKWLLKIFRIESSMN